MHYCGESKGERLLVLPSLYISLWGNFSGAANMEFGKNTRSQIILSFNQERALRRDALQGFSFEQLSADALS